MCFGQAPNTLPYREASFVIDQNGKGTEIPQKALDLIFGHASTLFGLYETVKDFGWPVARDNHFLTVR